MLTPTARACFETIYALDLVYSPGCWRLCGDAHCCNFTRYKSQMRLLGKSHRQELPLLPGEYEYLQETGGLAGYGQHEHQVVEYPIARGVLKIELMVGHAEGCICHHATRTTVCRLYPLLPVFSPDGQLVGVDTKFGMFEEIEAIAGIEPACKLTYVPFSELDKFLAITSAIGRYPAAMFYLSAYRIAKQHAAAAIVLNRAAAGVKSPSPLALFESLFLLRRLLDPSTLRPQLDSLADRYIERFGPSFVIGETQILSEDR